MFCRCLHERGSHSEFCFRQGVDEPQAVHASHRTDEDLRAARKTSRASRLPDFPNEYTTDPQVQPLRAPSEKPPSRRPPTGGRSPLGSTCASDGGFQFWPTIREGRSRLFGDLSRVNSLGCLEQLLNASAKRFNAIRFRLYGGDARGKCLVLNLRAAERRKHQKWHSGQEPVQFAGTFKNIHYMHGKIQNDQIL